LHKSRKTSNGANAVGARFDGIAASAYQSDFKKKYSELSSVWVVPENPTYGGPQDNSGVVLAPALSDKESANAVNISPLLSWGQNGCNLDKANFEQWSLIAFLSHSDRAHCGARVPVSAGDAVAGDMLITDKVRNIWTVTATPQEQSNSKMSKYSAALGNFFKIDSAEMVLQLGSFYACSSLPAQPYPRS